MDWLRAKKDMKTLFNKNGIKVSYENILPMEHNKNETSVILQEIKRKARSEEKQFNTSIYSGL